jgi:hypothetical protein
MSQVDNTLDELNSSMLNLRDSLSGIPYRQGSFSNTYNQFAKAVGYLVVQIEGSRVMWREGSE